MMLGLLSGTMPPVQDIMFVQKALHERQDVYKPMDVAKQLLQQAGKLDVSDACQGSCQRGWQVNAFSMWVLV